MLHWYSQPYIVFDVFCSRNSRFGDVLFLVGDIVSYSCKCTQLQKGMHDTSFLSTLGENGNRQTE